MRHVVSVSTFGDGRDAVIEVRDNGPGIAEEIREKVLEPFFSTKPVGTGTGLGLAISNKIVRDHGGSLRITSAEDGGARIQMLLPVDGPNGDAP